MSNANTSSPCTRDRGLRRLHRLTIAVVGGAVAALGATAYTAAVTIPGAIKVAMVTPTAAPSTVDTTTTTVSTPTATPTPAPTASSQPVAVSGGSRAR